MTEKGFYLRPNVPAFREPFDTLPLSIVSPSPSVGPSVLVVARLCIHQCRAKHNTRRSISEVQLQQFGEQSMKLAFDFEHIKHVCNDFNSVETCCSDFLHFYVALSTSKNV